MNMREEKFRDEELHGLYCSAYSLEIKSRNMRWAGACDSYRKEKCIQGFGEETWRK